MKFLVMITVLIVSCFINLSSAAEETCPAKVDTNGKYTAPVGWHVTKMTLDNLADHLLFYIATYNYDETAGNNENRISCVYKDRLNKYVLEITTDKNNYPLPTGSRWQLLDVGTHYCFPEKPVDPTDCPWG